MPFVPIICKNSSSCIVHIFSFSKSFFVPRDGSKKKSLKKRIQFKQAKNWVVKDALRLACNSGKVSVSVKQPEKMRAYKAATDV